MLLVVAGLAVAANGSLAFPARAQLVAQSEDFLALENDAFIALQLISEAARSEPCPGNTPRSVIVTGRSVTLDCSATHFWTHTFPYSEARITSMRVYRRYSPHAVEAMFRLNSDPRCCYPFDFVGDEAEARRFSAAWTILATQRTPREPRDDAEFLASLGSEAESQPAETLRRVQVQVEAALRANRNIEAGRLYRDALRTSPGWADGHYNLGLLYGDLELYPEAITEMRRYLYLTPNAQDARAVQDKIYEWEAVMAGAGQ